MSFKSMKKTMYTRIGTAYYRASEYYLYLLRELYKEKEENNEVLRSTVWLDRFAFVAKHGLSAYNKSIKYCAKAKEISESLS